MRSICNSYAQQFVSLRYVSREQVGIRDARVFGGIVMAGSSPRIKCFLWIDGENGGRCNTSRYLHALIILQLS